MGRGRRWILGQTERDEAVFTRLTDAFAKHAVVSEDIAQFYFDLGSDEATLDRHREKLYGLYKDMKVTAGAPPMGLEVPSLAEARDPLVQP